MRPLLVQISWTLQTKFKQNYATGQPAVTGRLPTIRWWFFWPHSPFAENWKGLIYITAFMRIATHVKQLCLEQIHIPQKNLESNYGK